MHKKANSIRIRIPRNHSLSFKHFTLRIIIMKGKNNNKKKKIKVISAETPCVCTVECFMSHLEILTLRGQYIFLMALSHNRSDIFTIVIEKSIKDKFFNSATVVISDFKDKCSMLFSFLFYLQYYQKEQFYCGRKVQSHSEDTRLRHCF